MGQLLVHKSVNLLCTITIAVQVKHTSSQIDRKWKGQLEKQGAGNGTGTGTGTGTGAGPERYRITSLIRAIKWV